MNIASAPMLFVSASLPAATGESSSMVPSFACSVTCDESGEGDDAGECGSDGGAGDGDHAPEATTAICRRYWSLDSIDMLPSSKHIPAMASTMPALESGGVASTWRMMAIWLACDVVAPSASTAAMPLAATCTDRRRSSKG